MVLDLILLAIVLVVALLAWRRGFFVTVLRLGAWIVSIAVAGALSNALARPIYEAFFAGPAQNMIEQRLGGALNASQAAQAAGQVIAELPAAVSQLAARLGGISTESLVAGLDARQWSTANASQLLEQSIVAPIGTAVVRFALALLVFALLMLITRLLCRQLEKLRKLPLLKKADGILGAALGLVKGVLLLFVLALLLRAAAALAEGTAFAEAVDSSRVVALLDFRF